jgi:gas vesicle protein
VRKARSNNAVSGLLFGAAVGVIAGLLLAPKPGKDSRRVVSARAGELRQKAVDYVSTVHQKMRGNNGEEAPEGATDQQAGTPG